MYNRYVPQPDGSYSRCRIPDPTQASRPVEAPASPPPVCASPPPPRPSRPSRPRQERPPAEPVGSFLRNLLPRDFGTEDLIVVLLLLLMAGSDPDKQNTALLTLALYLFL